MNARQSPTPAPGPDLLARYLNAYLQARQMSDVERPWGLGDDSLDSLWSRLTEAVANDPAKVNAIVREKFTEEERSHIVETMVPLIFALPLRTYPAELRGARSGERLILSLRHLEPHTPPAKSEHCETGCADNGKKKDKDDIEYVGHLPVALTASVAGYLRRVLHWPQEKRSGLVTISSGGRRRRVRVTILAHERGVVVRFLERVQSPADGPS
ncbi:MAG TPA: hypothetical protein VEK08_05845 [Planctomycetota bacterium]|nr:hypothetical protein [Planctomycetota bacterium]